MPNESTPIAWFIVNSFLWHLVSMIPMSLSTWCIVATWVGISTSKPPCIGVISTFHFSIISLGNFLCPSGPGIVIQENLILSLSHLQ
ncbi:hypothetical protein RchiOBHm_Chr6g0270791 [Rosa chinensis]|uniref:Uncharacterized protein n=1 Tax=Rosa chinensis TaxID=74649 RepID=A0A2P6PQU7_ROSCH|nr:hypothetical protein RchiOBHm_Chr6g0270791 [Rosa chinensis]